MGFLDFLKGSGDEDDAKADVREQDIARIEAGGIPFAAEQRLRELAGGRGGFTSGLSVADFALTRLEAIRPICQVMGTSVYKVGWQSYPWTTGWGSDAVLSELRRGERRARQRHALNARQRLVVQEHGHVVERAPDVELETVAQRRLERGLDGRERVFRRDAPIAAMREPKRGHRPFLLSRRSGCGR